MFSIENKLAQITDIISLPEIYQKIRRLMDDVNADIDDFGNVVKLDANLSMKLLKVVNSAYYGFTGEITSISRAVNLIGIGQLHNMVLGISAVDALYVPNEIIPLKKFWRRSLYTGVLSGQLAEQMKMRNRDRMFILGMLHEIGHLVLYANFPEMARQSIQLANEREQSIVHTEEKIMGLHYGQIGAKLMELWNLPVAFQTITRFQPTPQNATEFGTECALLHIAHGYAHKQFPNTNNETLDLINPAAWNAIQLTEVEVEESLQPALIASVEMEKSIIK